MRIISDDDFEKYKELEELKRQINIQIRELEDSANPETTERIKDLKNRFKEGSDKKTVDENIKLLKKFNHGLSYFQRFKASFERDIDIDPGRLLGLTDGIFGISAHIAVTSVSAVKVYAVPTA